MKLEASARAGYASLVFETTHVVINNRTNIYIFHFHVFFFLGVWHIEEKCLAPYFDNGELQEAVVKSIEHKKDDLSYAVVSFMDATERRIPFGRLRKASGYRNSWNTSIFDDEDLEKPYFPDQRPAAPSADFPLSNTRVIVPYTINRYLRDYQRDGIQFLYKHYTRSTGCILGDDMGLGKTIQVCLSTSFYCD